MYSFQLLDHGRNAFPGGSDILAGGRFEDDKVDFMDLGRRSGQADFLGVRADIRRRPDRD